MNIGCRTVAVTDAVQGTTIPVRVLYPTDAAARTETFGPYAIDLAVDAPLALERLPLVAISHGNGGTPWGYRWIATELVHAGFAVALVEHTGNSRTDNSLAGTPANLANRPRHITLALDATFAAFEAHLAPGAAVIGHSIGGYTALAACGGKPVALPNETPDGTAHPVAVTPDGRVHAAVLFAPALPWFMAPGALESVAVPLLVRSGERDELAPPMFIDRVLHSLPAATRVDHQVVAGAGHFAFFGPVPPHLASSPPGQDPPGFDRAAAQRQLCSEVLTFLRSTLTR